DPFAVAAASACVATHGPVGDQEAAAQRDPGLVIVENRTAEAVAAIAAVGAIASDGSVEDEGGLANRSDAAIPKAAARARTAPGASLAIPSNSCVERQAASLDREDRRGAEVRWVGGCRPVVNAAAVAVAPIASVRPVVGQRAARDGEDAPLG